MRTCTGFEILTGHPCGDVCEVIRYTRLTQENVDKAANKH